MDIRPIRTDADYDAAISAMDTVWDTSDDTAAGDRREVLAILIEAYERDQVKLPALTPVEAIRARMDMEGFTVANLMALIGPSASAVLNRRRKLTMDMARKLHVEWQIPAEILIQPYALKPQRP